MELAEALAEQLDGGLLPTPTVGDQREGKHLRSVAIENLKSGKNRGIGLNHLTEAIGVGWNEGDQFVITENGVEKVDALLPTPLAQDGSASMPPEERLANGYRPHLRDVEYLLPTPIVDDHKNGGQNTNRFPSLASVAHQELLPTPKARDHAPEGYEAGLRRHSPQLGTVMRAMVEQDLPLMGTPRVTSANGHTRSQVDSGATKSRIEDQVVAGVEKTINWGKFQPAIQRWERVIGRRAPEPTRPDGKDGAHRLNPKFTEWMMGLPDGWLTDIGLSRNNELKACGNGVVPQQAALALRQMLAIVDTLNH